MKSFVRRALALGLALAVMFLVQPYRPVIVRGESMAPTLEDGQLIVAQKPTRPLRVGDIVVFERQGSVLIKRVAMLPGTSYREVHLPHASFWSPLSTPQIRKLARKHNLPARTSTIPQGQIYVVGDNPSVSLDSRVFGTIPVKSVRAVLYQSV